jgi:hypothetical protein
VTAADVGSRIVAVADADATTVRIFGYGVYAGDFPRPGSGNWSPADYDRCRRAILDSPMEDDTSWLVAHWDRKVADGQVTRADADQKLAEGLANLARERAKPLEQRVEELLAAMDLNPRLDLDGGRVVWGCECWWMFTEEFDKFLGGRPVVEVPLRSEEVGRVA